MKRRIVGFSFVLMVCALITGIALWPSVGNVEAKDTTVEQWVSYEMTFVAEKNYNAPFYDVDLDIILTHKESGTTYTVPGFWDGGNQWKVRFALTELGEWNYETVSSDSADSGLHGKKGTVTCDVYTGDLDIYKHGFVTVQEGNRYFTYADGTPFFYLGDTHWHMMLEETENRFPTTLESRKEKGFTVIQSQTLGHWDNTYGNTGLHGIYEEFSSELLAQFQELDVYFKMIADYGFVHANSQFSYATHLGDYMNQISDADLERLCRYWVARYSSYPVMWTTSQECDNDYYYDQANSENKSFQASNNPWKKVAGWIHQYDPYKSPLTAHQENSGNTTASNSAFREVDGHNWWASQFVFEIDQKFPFDTATDYWNNGQGKVTVNFEGKYDHFWTTTAGARAQGWTSYLNGMYGYGYGSPKIWSANETPGIWGGAIKDSVSNGYETLTREDMDITWQESLNLPASTQLGYMREFLEENEWWKLEPQFNSAIGFRIGGPNVYHSVARDGANRVVIYFYNRTKDTGTAVKLDSECYYTIKWFNPRTGEYNQKMEKRVYVTNGRIELADKPDNEDWVVSVVKNHSPEVFKEGYQWYLEDNKIMGMLGNVTPSSFLDSLKTSDSATLTPLNDKNTKLVGTGWQLNLNHQNYTVVIKGDINGDGKVTSTDFAFLKRFFAGQIAFDDAVFIAADLDSSASIKSADFARMKNHFAGKIDLWRS